jgi:hypothetical protein
MQSQSVQRVSGARAARFTGWAQRAAAREFARQVAGKLAVAASACACTAMCAAICTAQSLPPAAQPLPLRNLMIEVRQVQSSSRDTSGITGSGVVTLGSGGQSGINGQLQIQQRSQTQSGSTGQLALVLNGRSTRISLGSSVPFRVYQTYWRNGQRVLGQGTVLLEAGTGFSATPRWDGSDVVELEIGAQQALSALSQPGGLNPQASVGSTVIVPLGEWSTIAQSEQSSSSTDRGLGGTGNSASQSSVEMQVRVTVR